MPESAEKKELLDSLYVEASEKTLDPALIDQPVLERYLHQQVGGF